MISIIVPIFNAEPYLQRCLDSILNQDYRDVELILVNDGSTDGSKALAERYQTADARVRLISQSNQGLAAARNAGMREATGEWLIFVDADDHLDAGYFSFMLNHIGEADMLQTGFRRVTPEGMVLEQKCPTPQRPYTIISSCMRLYRRAFLSEHQLFFPEGMIYEDVLFSARLWKQNPRICVEEYYGYNYLTNPTSITSRPHNTALIRRCLREEGLSLVSYNCLRLRLCAHFVKERIFHLFC